MEDFEASWSRMATPPLSGTRCMVTDGDVIVIATYLSEPDGDNVWVFNGITENDAKAFDVQGWMPIPKPIKKLVIYETPVKKDEK